MHDLKFLKRVTIQNISRFIKGDTVNIFTSIPCTEIYVERIEIIEKLINQHIADTETALLIRSKIDKFYYEIEELSFICGLHAGAKLADELLKPQIKK